jgi:hypothetical protein
LTAPTAAPPARPLSTAPALDSLIISGFPDIFAEFRGKLFLILWRGGRDGFGAYHFHLRCDHHVNTLTVILDTNGNIFGGFTPVEWESGNWNMREMRRRSFLFRHERDRQRWDCGDKADGNLKSFLFTLKNPYNVPARRFALKAEKKDKAICCFSDWGPCFYDIGVWDNCTVNTDSYTCYFGGSYTHDTGLDGKTFFTGSERFKVKEIEVFEITD